MKQKILFSLFLSFSYIFVYSQTNIYASPNGPNTNDGLSVGTAVNLQKAKDIARTIISNGPLTGDVIINILPGEHILNQTLVFDSNDSGNNGHYVIYKSYSSESPLISGGQKITGWSLHDQTKNIWKASIGNLYSRQLYVNGTKAVRARSNDSFNIYETKTGYFSTCNDFSTWGNIQDLEIVSCMHWRNHRIPVESICNNQIIINPIFFKYIHKDPTFESAPINWIENAYELIDSENEWYINKNTQTLYYKPSNNITTQETINALNIVLPKLEKLIDGQGINGANINNIKFIGLTFKYTTWNQASEYNSITGSNYGFSPNQADDTATPPAPSPYSSLGLEQIPAAISFKYSNNIHFSNNIVTHIGSTGLGFQIGSNNNRICNNRIEDISGSGILLGDFEHAGDPCLNPNLNPDTYLNYCTINNNLLLHNHVLVKNNIIENNFINNIANEYLSCVGIDVAFAINTIVDHNTISNFPYTGISFGLGLNRYFEHGTNNKITYNKIDCSKQFLGDGGGIYTESNLGETTTKLNNSLSSTVNRAEISHNYILNQTSYLGAIYLDQASSNINVHDNLIDIKNNIAIPLKSQCITNDVRAINCPTATSPPYDIMYTSHDVSIYNNYYNDKYSMLSNANYTGLTNIDFHSNTAFTGFQAQNSIITNSGQQTNYNCN
ncbi:hypothetical protein [Flavobacterium microcysteis]|uniref:Right-handed parallel beta-helix repeat-containing protein n=1 Tax=Flavobacterium microcysteis TaxID=2596891 RepID=A0A501Q426_9FLAO|nr:hypothetical protein [Flavobacterium microcysteis]TPD66967.1 hypothetical protein FJA49_11845 [Flavobacterium microcysteis]